MTPQVTQPVYRATMKGTLRPRTEGSWTLQVYAGRDEVTGRDIRVTRTVKAPHSKAGRKTAEAELARLVLEVEGHHHVPAEEITLGELVDRWIELRGPDWSPSTLSGVRQRLGKHLPRHLRARKVANLRPIDFDTLYANLRPTLAPATIRKVHAALTSALRQAVAWQMIATNPASAARPPSIPKGEISPPAKVDVQRVIAGIDDPAWAAYVIAAATTGARRSQLLALRWGDVDLEQGTITFARGLVRGDDGLVEKSTKSNRAYTVAIGPKVVAALARLRRRDREALLTAGVALLGDPLVWHTDVEGVQHWHPTSISRKWKTTAELHGLDGVRLHDLRHHVATELLAAGVDVVTVAKRLGHANTAVTLSTYAHFVPPNDRDAAAIIEGLA